MSWPSSLNEPARVPLGRLETPLERLARTSSLLGIDVWVKRDDLTGSALSGNKVRKLEYLVADAERREASSLITCGGVNSNHARATAVAAAKRGLAAHLLLRGEDRRPATGNLLLDRWVGAETSFVDAEGYRGRERRMAALAEAGTGQGYVIPEGGSNGMGAMGYVRCAGELVAQAEELGLQIGRVVHACGSGGTTAGLALGFSALGVSVDLVSVAVMADATHFDPIIREILHDAVFRGTCPRPIAERARWTVLDGWVGRGYAQTTSEEMADLHGVARREGLVLDPVYTGKAFLPILRGKLPPTNGATVFIHTGGIFELFAYPDEVEEAAGR